MKIKSSQSHYNNSDAITSLDFFIIRKSNKAKRLSIKVFPRGLVEVVSPKNKSNSEINEFIDSNNDWIKKTRDQFSKIYTQEAFELPNYINLPAINQQFKVDYIYKENINSVRYQSKKGHVILTGKICDEELCVSALKRWLANLARSEFKIILLKLSNLIGNSFTKLQIRGQRSCWGSYSSSGNLSLNYCLLFLYPIQLRYVMIHELCHISHLNHSRKFWKLVEKYEPNYKELDNELNNNWEKIPVWLGIY